MKKGIMKISMLGLCGTIFGTFTNTVSSSNLITSDYTDEIEPANSITYEDLNEHDHTDWSPVDSYNLPSDDGSYYVRSSFQISSQINITGNITLCLNNRTISRYTSSSIYDTLIIYTGYLFYVTGTLTLVDCEGNGTINGLNSRNLDGVYSVIHITEGGTFNMYGGTIADNGSASSGAYTQVTSYGTINMFNGAILFTDNLSSGVNSAVGIRMYGGIFNMYNGTISWQCSSRPVSNEHGVFLGSNNCIFNMHNGTISGFVNGVSVGSDSVFNMFDGTITDNDSGVSVWGGEFNMNGGVITDNLYSSHVGSAVSLSNGATFIMKNGEITNNSTSRYDAYSIVISNSSFYFLDGEISTRTPNDNIIYISSGTFEMSSGYLDGIVDYRSGTISITGGYLSEYAYASFSGYIDDLYVAVDLSEGEGYGDDGWVSSYSYAVYLNGETNYSISDIEVSCDKRNNYENEISINGNIYDVGITYTYSDRYFYYEGLPNEVGSYFGYAFFDRYYDTANKTYIDEVELRFEITIKDHTYGDWVVIVEPTDTQEGSKMHTCELCGYSETQTIELSDLTNDVGDSNGENDNTTTIFIVVGAIAAALLVVIIIVVVARRKKAANSN